MVFLFGLDIVIITILYAISRSRFKEELSILDYRKEKFKMFLPIGMQILKYAGYKPVSSYEKKLMIKLRELHGERNVFLHIRIHMAKKLVLFLFAAAFICFTGTQVEVDFSFASFGLILTAALLYAGDKQLDNMVRERRREMQIEFPEFLNKLILLVNAGLTVSGALQRIVKENKKGCSLYLELYYANNELNSGKTEAQVFEDFAKRCKLPEVTMFAATLIQNLRKGNGELIPILRLQALASWENRKNLARKLGEEASTKLLAPMIIVFIAILIMIMTPAVFQLQI